MQVSHKEFALPQTNAVHPHTVQHYGRMVHEENHRLRLADPHLVANPINLLLISLPSNFAGQMCVQAEAKPILGLKRKLNSIRVGRHDAIVKYLPQHITVVVVTGDAVDRYAERVERSSKTLVTFSSSVLGGTVVAMGLTLTRIDRLDLSLWAIVILTIVNLVLLALRLACARQRRS